MAIFQIELVDPRMEVSKDIARVNLQHTISKTKKETAFSVPNNYAPLDSIDKEIKFATAVTMFSLKLKQSAFVEEIDWTMVTNMAKTSAANNYLQSEFLQLVEKAKKIYPVKKKKKKNAKQVSKV